MARRLCYQEEVYSLAILLKEANLLDRSTIYATDISESALVTARQGIYSLPVLKAGSSNYLLAGGSKACRLLHLRWGLRNH